MLILKRRIGEALMIGDDVKIVVTGLNFEKIFIAIDGVSGKEVNNSGVHKVGGSFVLSDDVVIHVLDINGNQVKIGIEAPKSISVQREEIYNKIQKEKSAA